MLYISLLFFLLFYLHLFFFLCFIFVFFFKQNTAYEMRFSDWISDVCSSDLILRHYLPSPRLVRRPIVRLVMRGICRCWSFSPRSWKNRRRREPRREPAPAARAARRVCPRPRRSPSHARKTRRSAPATRSEEHTSELQSLMRISSAVFCLKKKKQHAHITDTHKTQIQQYQN